MLGHGHPTDPTTVPAAVLRTRALSRVYRSAAGEVQALRGVDFHAARGEFVVILGPFWRSPAALTGGKGLGPTIADRLQRPPGGGVNLFNPPDGGCEIVLRFVAGA